MIWDKLNEQDWQKVAPYVDTLLIPVVNVDLKNKATLGDSSQESVHAAVEIERQLKGRVVLMPPVAYVADEDWLQTYIASIRRRAEKGGFRHLFFVVDERLKEETPHTDWGESLLVPATQIRQLCEQIIQKWQNEV